MRWVSACYQMLGWMWHIEESVRWVSATRWIWHIEECVRWVSASRCLAECDTLRSVWDGSALPDGSSTLRSVWDGSVLPDGSSTLRSVWDGSALPDGSSTLRNVWDGSVLPDGSSTLRSVWDGSALLDAWLNLAHWGESEATAIQRMCFLMRKRHDKRSFPAVLSVILKAEQSLMCGIPSPWPPCSRLFVSGWCHHVIAWERWGFVHSVLDSVNSDGFLVPNCVQFTSLTLQILPVYFVVISCCFCLRMYLWWSLYTLYLHVCQVRVTVGNSGFVEFCFWQILCVYFVAVSSFFSFVFVLGGRGILHTCTQTCLWAETVVLFYARL